MKTKFLYFIFGLIVLAACNSSTPQQEANAAANYTNKELGWTITIPEGYKLISKAKIEVNDQKGKEAINKVYEGEVNTDSLKHLVSFQKNQLNIFDSTIEPYVEKYPGEYETNNQALKKLLFDTYNNQKIKIDTLSGKEVVQGLDFNAFYIKVYGPSGAVLMHQVMYSTLLKGYDFGVNINYNNEEDKKILMDAFKNSKFK
ncbi:hypothetical protein [Pedobacter sp. UC225_65]|uniref:hypothetical protein n=1 Tax=Pedobacter sp. UC225_65 TaxID=3350173 RepID=UPI0036716BE1